MLTTHLLTPRLKRKDVRSPHVSKDMMTFLNDIFFGGRLMSRNAETFYLNPSFTSGILVLGFSSD